MDPDTELQEAYDEVLRKIGRNLLLFQKAEHLLKHLLTLGNLQLIKGEEKSFDEQHSIWSKHTLGGAITRFLEKHCVAENPIADFAVDGDKTAIAFSFTLGGDAVERKAALDELVTARNEFVHQLLLRLDEDSLESCRQMKFYLDHQRTTVISTIERLQDDYKRFKAQLSDMLAYLGTDDGMAMLQPPKAN